MNFSPTVSGGGLQLSFPFHTFNSLNLMASTIFAERDFSRIFTDVNQYGHAFIDRIRERNWYTLLSMITLILIRSIALTMSNNFTWA